MRVKELIEQLQKVDAECEVMLSIDEEGNEFKSIYEITEETDVEKEDETVVEKCIIIWPY